MIIDHASKKTPNQNIASLKKKGATVKRQYLFLVRCEIHFFHPPSHLSE